MSVSPPPAQFDAIAEREQGLRRGLSSPQLTMIALGGAIGTGLFLGSGFAIGLAGPAVLVSYGFAAFITLLLMGCLAEMAIAHPTPGSFGAWAEFYLSPLAGFLVRYAYWACIVLALGTEVSAIAIYMQFWFPSTPAWIWIFGFTSVLVIVNAFNVKLFGAIEYGLSAFKVLAILAFVLLGAWVVVTARPGSGISFLNYVRFGGFFPHGLWGTWVAILVALFSFFSVEMIAVAAGEAEHPRQAVLQAFRATLFRLVLFYILTLGLILAILPWTVTQTLTGANQSPFVRVMLATHIPGAGAILNFVILVAALSAMNSQLYTASRMLFSLSRSGFSLRIFGLLTRAGVPVPALLISTSGIALAAILDAFYHQSTYGILLAVSVFGALFVWMMIFITHLRFRRVHAGEPLAFRMWGFPWTSLLGASLMAATLLTTLFSPPFHATLLYGGPFLIVLTIAFYLRRSTMHPEPITPEPLTESQSNKPHSSIQSS